MQVTEPKKGGNPLSKVATTEPATVDADGSSAISYMVSGAHVSRARSEQPAVTLRYIIMLYRGVTVTCETSSETGFLSKHTRHNSHSEHSVHLPPVRPSRLPLSPFLVHLWAVAAQSQSNCNHDCNRNSSAVAIQVLNEGVGGLLGVGPAALPSLRPLSCLSFLSLRLYVLAHLRAPPAPQHGYSNACASWRLTHHMAHASTPDIA